MKHNLKALQIAGFFMMILIVIRAELLHIIKVEDYHFYAVYTAVFILSIILILIYPIYTLIKKHTFNPLNWIKSIVKVIKDYVNK